MNQLLAMRAFIRVLESGSFGRAADQMALPRSTLSKLIADLEGHLKVKLVNRSTRRVAATSEGLEYLVHARRIVEEVEAVDSALSGQTLKPQGHLRVDAPASFAVEMLIPALPQFHSEYPGISVAVGISDRTVNVIGEGVDCAIRAGGLDDSGLVARRITEMQYVTCAAPSYLAAHGIPATPDDLRLHHRLVAYFYSGSGRLDAPSFSDGERTIVFDQAVFTTNEGNGLTALLLAGAGVGQSLRPLLQRHLDSGELVEVLPGWTRPLLPFHALYPPNRNSNARLAVFLDWLDRTFGAVGNR